MIKLASPRTRSGVPAVSLLLTLGVGVQLSGRLHGAQHTQEDSAFEPSLPNRTISLNAVQCADETGPVFGVGAHEWCPILIPRAGGSQRRHRRLLVHFPQAQV